MKSMNIFLLALALYPCLSITGQIRTNSEIRLTAGYDFCLDGTASFIYTGEANEILKISIIEKTIVRRIQTEHECDITAIDLSKDGKYIVTGDKCGIIQLIDSMGNLIKSFNHHQGTVYSLEFHPDKSCFVSSASDGKIYLTYIDDRHESYLVAEDPNPVYCATFHSDGSLMAAGFYNGWLRIYEFTTKNESYSRKIHNGPVRTIKFGREGTIYSGGDDKKLLAWDYKKDLVEFPGINGGFRDWILSFYTDEDEKYQLLSNYAGYVRMEFFGLIYITCLNGPALKSVAIQKPDSSIEVIALVLNQGIIFFSLENMEIEKVKGLHEP